MGELEDKIEMLQEEYYDREEVYDLIIELKDRIKKYDIDFSNVLDDEATEMSSEMEELEKQINKCNSKYDQLQRLNADTDRYDYGII